jgi:regulator of nonsense transcripts 1
MNLLEDSWAAGQPVTVRDLPALANERRLAGVQDGWSSLKEYARVFGRLLEAEREDEIRGIEKRKLTDVMIVWGETLAAQLWEGRFTGRCVFQFLRGDDVEIVNDELDFHRVGRIIRIVQNTVVIKVLFGGDKWDAPPPDPNVLFEVFPTYDEIQYRRQTAGLRKLEKLSPLFQSIVLGRAIELRCCKQAELDVPMPLDESQKEAVVRGLTGPFTLVQGPPGTGKTSVIAALCFEFVRRKQRPILVTAPSNVSVEHVTVTIARLGLKVVRFAGRKYDELPSPAADWTVYNIILRMAGHEAARFQELDKVRLDAYLKPAQLVEWRRLRFAFERKLLTDADIVCCTPDMAGSGCFRGLVFPYIICDEATQATEPKLLSAFLHGAKEAVLVGDQQQLGPTIMSDLAREAGLGISLFERVVRTGICESLLLEFQYRMHPALSEWPSNFFYEGSLQNGVSVRDRTPKYRVFPFPVQGLPMVFLHREAREERSDVGGSYVNQFEAMLVVQALQILRRQHVPPEAIGIITPYSGQKSYITEYLAVAPGMRLEEVQKIVVASVDGFQGSERDYIIVSCVRSNPAGSLGFLADSKRLNVAVTRAKFGLIMVGNARTLAGNEMWRDLLEFFQSKNVLVDGTDWNDTRPSVVVLRGQAKKGGKEKGRQDYDTYEADYFS